MPQVRQVEDKFRRNNEEIGRGPGGDREDSRARGGAGVAGRSEFEETIGFAWHITRFMKIEQGIAFKPGAVSQLVLAWEYSFAGEN